MGGRHERHRQRKERGDEDWVHWGLHQIWDEESREEGWERSLEVLMRLGMVVKWRKERVVE